VEKDAMDYYDVHAAIGKAVNEERWWRNRHVEDVTRDLRAEFRREVMELREEVGELFADVWMKLGTDTKDLENAHAAITNLASARTEQEA
jgi:hypothetical protein